MDGEGAYPSIGEKGPTVNTTQGENTDHEEWTSGQRLTTLEQLLAIRRLPLSVVIDRACLILQDVLDIDDANVYRYDDALNALIAESAFTTPMAHHQQALGLDRLAISEGGRVVEVFQTGNRYYTGHAEHDPQIRAGFTRDLGIRSLAVVPFTVDGRRRGVLQVAATKPDYFSATDLHFLDSVAQWVGLVFQRAEFAQYADMIATQQRPVDELVTVLAHDLRGFLAPLQLRLDTLNARAQREQRPQDVQDSVAARATLARLERMITHLLDTERLDQGLFTPIWQQVDVATLARETAALMSTGTNPITVNAPSTLVVSADPDAIRRALENLLANAVKYSPAHTGVDVTVGTEFRQGGDSVLLTVRDHGPGIPSDVLPQLFQRFVVGPGSRGFGLGLYLANRIALAHSGTLTVDSTPGVGTQFHLRFPIDAPVLVGATQPTGDADERHARRIAVVNDDPFLLDAMRDALVEEGYDAVLFKVGVEAHRAFQEMQPDLIILDVSPAYSEIGWLLLEVLQYDPVVSHIPVIVSSTDAAFVQAWWTSLQAHGGATLQKPFARNVLLAAVRAALA